MTLTPKQWADVNRWVMTLTNDYHRLSPQGQLSLDELTDLFYELSKKAHEQYNFDQGDPD